MMHSQMHQLYVCFWQLVVRTPCKRPKLRERQATKLVLPSQDFREYTHFEVRTLQTCWSLANLYI